MTNKAILKGTYCILIDLKSKKAISIGKLGEIDFQKGYYIYVGSALNSLLGRIKRHLSSDKKIYWHIDYLLAHDDAEIVDILFVVNIYKWECKLAEKIADRGVSVKNFGCSDCKCNSHLFYFKNLDDLRRCCLDAFRMLKLEPENYFE